ncbi:MAG TPA: hypothetical protein DCP25_10790 [Chloroflexi bacterium]|nr:hypothetical protein [Chloroflexota bacterium]
MRLFALVPVLVAVGSVVLDVVFLEFFGAFLLPLLSQLVYVGVGLLLTLRLPRQPVGWLLLWAGALFQLAFAAGAYKWAAFIRAPGTLPLGEVALLIGIAWLPALGCLFLAIMLFPTGRPPSPRWRLPAAVVVMATALGLVAELLGPREFPVQPSPFGAQGALPLTVANPLAIDGPLGTLLGYVGAFPLVVYLIPVAAVLVRFRTAAGTERQQLKWFAYAASIVMVFFVATGFGLFSYLGGVLASLVAVVVMDLIPISVAIAILRYRLYDIDLLINRTLVYGATTAVIGGAFFGGIVLLQTLLRPFTTGSELSVAASTLVSFALFQPLRRRIERAVDQRFYRSRYDAGRTVDAFSERLGDLVEVDALRSDLLTVVGDTMQPVHASLWLRR